MVFSLCMFSFALFLFLPGLSLIFFSQCIFTRQNLASIVVLVSFGFLGVAEAVTGILGASTGSMISSAVLDGFCQYSTSMPSPQLLKICSWNDYYRAPRW